MKTKQVKRNTTKAKKVNNRKVAKKVTKPELSQVTKEALDNGKSGNIPIDLIDFNPKNRRYYSQKNLEAFANVLKTRGQIHEVIVVEAGEGRYKLIAGHRRIKSMRIAGFKTVRANIVILTEAQEKEIMFSENADRENPHPLDDAALIASMQEDELTMEEIALRLVKPLAFVYNRIKLNSLSEPLKEVFVEEKCMLKEALQLASLSEDSQTDFFNDYCSNWREEEDFMLDDIDHVLSNYLYDLNRAPFDIKEKDLVENVGACTKCQYNSATLSVLFPELANESICSNKSCYGNKCTAYYRLQIAQTLLNEKPEAIIFTTHFADDLRSIIKSLPETADLPAVDYYYATAIQAPEEPQKEIFSEFNKKGEAEFFDEENYRLAMAEYESNKHEFELMIHAGEVQRGLFVGQKEIKLEYFRKKAQGAKSNIPQQTKKQVDDAIKSNTATPKLLEDEIIRMNEKKKRAAVLMRGKVQMAIHKDFTDILKKLSNCKQIVDADIITTRVVMYQWLDINAQNEVDKVFGIGNDFGFERRYEILSLLTDEQTSYLIRKALQSKSDSKYPKNLLGYCLYKHAENWRIDIKGIEEKQAKITNDEINDYEQRIEEMSTMLETLKIKAA